MTANADLTRNQTLVLDALSQAEAPLSAYSILDRLRDHGLRAPLQVYRALEKLTGMGLVHRLESLNAFVACVTPHCHDHDHGLVAFAICETCGRVDEFADDGIGRRLGALAGERGFHARKTTVELRGDCAACAAAGRDAKPLPLG